jgi:CYTH domain-containing protein
MEIERKWLLKAFPVGQHKTHCYIFQTYLASYDDCEIRIRYCEPALDHKNKPVSPYKFTYKSGGDLCRNEVEKELTAQQFDELKRNIPYPAISKNFYTYEYDGHTIEISKVDDDWIYAEVEFNNELEAINYDFPWPSLVIEDVTENKEYKMKNYWRKTRLKEEI